jgi:hypothetical protein
MAQMDAMSARISSLLRIADPPLNTEENSQYYKDAWPAFAEPDEDLETKSVQQLEPCHSSTDVAPASPESIAKSQEAAEAAIVPATTLAGGEMKKEETDVGEEKPAVFILD